MENELYSDKELHSLYQKWLFSRPPEEFELCLTILEYEESFFEDMTFQENSLCWNICSFLVEEFDSLYLELSPSMYRFYIVDDNKPYAGQCNKAEHTISITRSHVNDKAVILHEMIHAYEFILDKKHPMLHEYLMLALYKKLSPLIDDLDKRLSEHGEMYGQYRVTSSGGYHGLLFYLKSLDLDIRCKYPLGTICGYGRDTGNMWY